MFLNAASPRGHGIDHGFIFIRRQFRHFEQFNDGFVDRKIEKVLYLPANGRLDLVGRHVGNLDQDQADNCRSAALM